MSLALKGKLRGSAVHVAAIDEGSPDGWKFRMGSTLPEIPAEAMGTWGWPMKFSELIKGDYYITSRDFPKLVAHGCTKKEAREHAQVALEEEVDRLMDGKKKVPPPSKETGDKEELVFMSARKEETLYGYLNCAAELL